jgi:hypothetical protein
LKWKIVADWDGPALEQRIKASQHNRKLINESASSGGVNSWDWQPLKRQPRQYVVGNAQEENALSRFPRIPSIHHKER